MPAYVEVWSPTGRVFVALDGPRVTVGSDPCNGVALSGDRRVSRVHAVFESYGACWSIRDLGSRNGTYVNGTQIFAEQVLRPGDELRVGESRLIYRAEQSVGEATLDTLTGHTPPELTRRERDVLAALCRPLFSSEPFPQPGSIREIAAELTVTEAAVKQHLLRLYEKFDVFAGTGRRVRLANEAVRRGAVNPVTLRSRSGA
jgi:pSer/pThr/pTyr-binding forkhead associated (FHA) protein